MSGILVVSGRPRPQRLTATVADAVPPPPRDLPRVNPVLPATLVAVTMGVVYFGGLLQVGNQGNAVVATKAPEANAAKAKPTPIINYAPKNLAESRAGERPSLVATVRLLAYTVATEPTTAATYQERLAAMRSYFSVLTPVDRTSLFGVTDFQAFEQFLLTLEPKVAWQTLDRFFVRLQATFHRG